MAMSYESSQSRGSADEAERLLEHGGGGYGDGTGRLHEDNEAYRTRRRSYTERRVTSVRDRYDLYGERKKNVLSRTWTGFTTFLAVSGLVALMAMIFGYLVIHPQEDVFWPDWDHSKDDKEMISRYPTDFTRDVIPVPCHSHNDYWRRIPFFDAVHAGCVSVEADVWAYGDQLYVGHSIPSLTPNRTFESMYVDPILTVLDRMNPPTLAPYDEVNGVFDEVPEQALILLVDFKTEPEITFQAVKQRLEPLRQKNYLTYFNGSAVIPGVVTVVGTGNTPFELVEAEKKHRDIFFDAPIAAFSAANQTEETKKYTPFNTFYASGSLYKTVGFPWAGKYSAKQLEKIRDHIKGAQKQGIKARYWDTPAWPIGLRNSIWSLLLHEGADVLNVDSLTAATKHNWGTWG